MAAQSEASKTLEIDLMVFPKHKDNPILRQMHAWISGPLPEPRLFAYTVPNTGTYMVSWNAQIKRAAGNCRWSAAISDGTSDTYFPGMDYIPEVPACLAYQSMQIYRLYISYAMSNDFAQIQSTAKSLDQLETT